MQQNQLINIPISSAICVHLVLHKCFEDTIPFSNIANYDLYETNVGIKINFRISLKNLNNAMDYPGAENLSSKYFEPHELLKNYIHFFLKIRNLFLLSFISITPHFLFTSNNFQNYLLTKYHLI